MYNFSNVPVHSKRRVWQESTVYYKILSLPSLTLTETLARRRKYHLVSPNPAWLKAASARLRTRHACVTVRMAGCDCVTQPLPPLAVELAVYTNVVYQQFYHFQKTRKRVRGFVALRNCDLTSGFHRSVRTTTTMHTVP
jgi:hypothetical protein